MTETVVHVTTLEQWKSVLDVWFKKGYKWSHFEKGDYLESVFSGSNHYLHLDDYISQTPGIYGNASFIEYSEFMAQQEKTMVKETYYVTQEQLDLITELKSTPAPLDWVIMDYDIEYRALREDITAENSNAIMRYLGGDTSIEFKLIEQLYRLWREEMDNDTIYMCFNYYDTPIVTRNKNSAFTAPREEIEKWKTPAWEIEEVK